MFFPCLWWSSYDLLECYVALYTIIEIQFFPSLINRSKRDSYVEVTTYTSQTTLTQNTRPVLILSMTHLLWCCFLTSFQSTSRPLQKPITSQKMQEISHVVLIQCLRNHLASVIFLLFLPQGCQFVFTVIVMVGVCCLAL